MSRVSYNKIFTENFKFNSYTINLLMPLTEKNATYCALLSQVLKRGCEKYGEMHQIVALLESLYGASVNISSDKLGENLSFTVQGYFMENSYAVEGENILESVLDLMAQLLFCPMTEDGAFRKDYFEQEKNNLSDVIRGTINDKRTFAIIRCKEIMFADSQYRFTGNGTLECLEGITSASLIDFYRQMLSQAKVLVTYIGHRVAVEDLTQTYFGQLNDGKDVLLASGDHPLTSSAPKYVAESFDVAQGKLTMGFRFIDETDYYATRLFNVVFGGSPTSKLFMNVREKLSLCYYCSSAVDPFVHSMFISSGIEFENYEIAKAEILRQLDDMKNGKIGADEFENGKKYLLDYIKGMNDSHGALISDGLRGYLLNMNDSPEKQIEKRQKKQKRISKN